MGCGKKTEHLVLSFLSPNIRVDRCDPIFLPPKFKCHSKGWLLLENMYAVHFRQSNQKGLIILDSFGSQWLGAMFGLKLFFVL